MTNEILAFQERIVFLLEAGLTAIVVGATVFILIKIVIAALRLA